MGALSILSHSKDEKYDWKEWMKSATVSPWGISKETMSIPTRHKGSDAMAT